MSESGFRTAGKEFCPECYVGFREMGNVHGSSPSVKTLECLAPRKGQMTLMVIFSDPLIQKAELE